MTKMIRTFHAVGQGAFYTEEFGDEFTMVYDCGSYTGSNIIEDEIKKSGLKTEIDLLVISHFHADHINGLNYLLENYTIKNILLPFLHDDEKIEVYLHNSQASEFVKKLCLNPINTISEISGETSVVFVNAYSEENDRDRQETIDLREIDSERNINSGTSISMGRQWIYVPFNFRYTRRSVALTAKFTAEGIPLGVTDFVNFYLENQDKVRDAYRSIPGDMNTNSLVLYSGVKEQPEVASFNYFINSRPFCHSRYNPDVGCLYMGDYNAKGVTKMDNLESEFSRYYEYIGTIQIPHHGSRHNYNPRLHFKNLICVISAGMHNSYRHPHGSTLKQIVQNDGIPVIVTESPSSRLVQKITLFQI